jgi:preprotein translocase subunit SecB
MIVGTLFGAVTMGNRAMVDNLGQQNTRSLPQLNVLAQYIKDFSFENPNAPKSLEPRQQAPEINIQVNVEAKQFSESDFEVGLNVEGRAADGSSVLFQFELAFAGMFRLQNIAAQDLHPIIMIECPRLLFPFARQIIGDAVRNGGFPPLLLEPIDFVALYRQRLAEQQGAKLDA